MSSSRINVTVKPGVVLLEVTVGPLSVSVAINPRDADALAGAIQRGAIEANAPRLVGVPPPANGHDSASA